MSLDLWAHTRRYLPRVAAVLLALCLWQVAAMAVGAQALLPSPIDVLCKLFEVVGAADFLAVFFYSAGRIALGFLCGFVAGVLLALLSARFRVAETLLFPYMVTVRSIPVASFVVLAYLLLDRSALSGFISFLIVLPLVYNNLLAALRERSRELDEMAAVFSVSYFDRLRYIWVPAIRPALLSASSSSIGLAWKSGVAAELIAMVGGSIGDQIYLAKLNIDTPSLFAWTVVIVLGSLLSEKLFTLLLGLLLGGGMRRERHRRPKSA